MEQVINREEMNELKEWNDALEADVYEVQSGEETETLFMVEEIEAV